MLISKCTYKNGVDGVDRSHTMIDQVKAGAPALGDWVVEDVQ
jgi:hypothetical protein